ncbi:unnamed protein product, partial [Gongylonema pulchrum]|uniref:Protein DEK-like n=1 Tax=Gongylonema pulchrum TaxID=637853 RepID=A0A183DBE3_9BILA
MFFDILVVNSIARILGTERGHGKEDTVTNVLHFLQKPEDKGKKAPMAKKRSSSSRSSKRGKKQKRTVKRAKKVGAAKETEDEDSDDNESQSGEESSGGEEENETKSELKSLVSSAKKKGTRSSRAETKQDK